MLGVSIENNFSVAQHVQRLVNASAQTVYELRVCYGLADWATTFCSTFIVPPSSPD